jgi:hypothetical protein
MRSFRSECPAHSGPNRTFSPSISCQTEEVAHHCSDTRLFCRGCCGASLCAAAIFPGVRPSGTRCRSYSAANASIYASDAAAAKLDAILNGDPDVERWSTYVGRGAIRFYLPLDVKLANDFLAQSRRRRQRRRGARAPPREAGESTG